jgi:hypothetical protein
VQTFLRAGGLEKRALSVAQNCSAVQAASDFQCAIWRYSFSELILWYNNTIKNKGE